MIYCARCAEAKDYPEGFALKQDRCKVCSRYQSL